MFIDGYFERKRDVSNRVIDDKKQIASHHFLSYNNRIPHVVLHVSPLAVSRSANRSKGAKDPAQWMPQNVAFHCEYIFIRIS
jgi:hypothetical protein